MANGHFKDNEYFTVSQLNGLIQEVLNLGFPRSLWICGEIQGYDRNKDKSHIFFELCEKDPQTKDIVARIGLVIFASRKAAIKEVLRSSENAFDLKDDIEVKFLCKVDFYPPHGAVRLVVEAIDPVYTLGKIAQEKQRLIKTLKDKGILDKNKQHPLSLVPLHIGLITAYDSAAYNDFLSELKHSGFGFKIFFRNALMQGKNAETAVCRALEDLGGNKDLDAIVITRGGGSIAELSCFDSEAIAVAIAASPLPVLSGIGHEINITVTDLAACVYQKTPTAIARLLVARVEEFLALTQEKAAQIITLAQDRLEDQRRALKDAAFDIQQITASFFKAHHQQIMHCHQVLSVQPVRILRRRREDLKVLKAAFSKAVQNRFKDMRQQLKHYAHLVEFASPGKTLQRGFSITRCADGRVIRSVADIRLRDIIRSEVADGVIQSQVENIQKDKEVSRG